MHIIINDEAFTLPTTLTLTALLQQLSYSPSGIALAVNQHIVPRDRWAERYLQEGDELVIFQAIAGG
ncbi:sulfur carrier protein ThiS [Erwinia psidii]|uniref:Sulfur carrier protein ThiS n=1 Tax=Erwinia psidii TaxID=69224 RepID=A0A3N6S2G4_9GAMM|nr:sulfur carrier protein ThiS [Erwinia psidii]MCX8958631.1 sulfur carrier protein ThiS [Erwinia psidii]MCX8963273.1 sulfur carrier protein ThiS [Erwinia psidii]RQM39027.1 sulfur carrier protein ThiS [Erwinia psidii]